MDERPPARRERPLLRWLTTAWCLLAGAFLSMAPRVIGPGLEPWADPTILDVLLTSRAVAWCVSAFGLVLLAAGAWDVSRLVVEELA